MQVNPYAKLTAKQLAGLLGVTPQLVNRWRTNGWIDPETKERRYLEVVGRDYNGDRQYHYVDGAKANAATKRSKKSHRGPRELAAA